MKIREACPDLRGEQPTPPAELFPGHSQPGDDPDYRVALRSGKITIATILLLVWLLAFGQILNNQINPVHEVPNPAYQAAANLPAAANAVTQRQTPARKP